MWVSNVELFFFYTVYTMVNLKCQFDKIEKRIGTWAASCMPVGNDLERVN